MTAHSDVRYASRRRLVLALMLLAPAAPVIAQPPQPAAVSDAPHVEQLVERALSRAPSLAARRARIEAVALTVKAADALPDPMVEFEYRAGGFPLYTIGSDPGSMLGASVRQNLLSKGRRAARREVATAGVAQNRAELDLLATKIATAIRQRYARLYVIDREEETLGDAAQLLRLLEATASARYAAGDADQASVLRVQLERTTLGERLADVATERLIVLADLNRLMDNPPSTSIGRVRALPMAAEPAGLLQGALPDAATDGASEIALRRADIDVAGKRVAEARQELRRAWSVGAGLYWQGGLDRMATITVGVELPFWKKRKQLPMIAAAERELEAARADIADTTAAVRAEATGLIATWRTATEQIERYRTAIVPQNAAALDATRSSYLAGRGDFISVLEEFRRWIDVRVGVASREADRYAAEVALDALVDPASAPRTR